MVSREVPAIFAKLLMGENHRDAETYHGQRVLSQSSSNRASRPAAEPESANDEYPGKFPILMSEYLRRFSAYLRVCFDHLALALALLKDHSPARKSKVGTDFIKAPQGVVNRLVRCLETANARGQGFPYAISR